MIDWFNLIFQAHDFCFNMQNWLVIALSLPFFCEWFTDNSETKSNTKQLKPYTPIFDSSFPKVYGRECLELTSSSPQSYCRERTVKTISVSNAASGTAHEA